MMHGHEKSDPAIVAGKPTNKAERSAAELVEPRVGTKGNAGQLSTRRTPSRISVTQDVGSHTASYCRPYPRWEPYAGKPHVRICAGGTRQLVSLPLNRRDAITLLGGAAVAWPLAARAQQPKMPVVGFLRSASPQGSENLVAALRQGLKEAGYIEGQNVAIEFRFAENRLERLPALVADLVRRQVAVIVANTAAALAAKAVTSTVPIIFVTGGDPIREGLVTSLNRPVANITGVSSLGSTLGAKKLEILRELAPKATTIAVLVDANNPDVASALMDVQAAAHALGQKIVVLNFSSEHDLDTASATLAQQRADTLLILGGALALSLHRQIVSLAARHALPALYSNREFIEAGGLMTYGASTADAYRQAGTYVGKILTGAKAADLPVQLAVIAATGGIRSVLAAKAATATIPIVFNSGSDPVKLGLLTSLNRPGGNLTGISWHSGELGGKRLALLHELVPDAAVVAVLLDRVDPEVGLQTTDAQEAARSRPAAHRCECCYGQRTRRGLRGPRAAERRRTRRHVQCILPQPARSDRRAGGAPRGADNLFNPRVYCGRWSDELRQCASPVVALTGGADIQHTLLLSKVKPLCRHGAGSSQFAE